MDIVKIRRALENYNVFPCRLYHEKVILDKVNGKPLILLDTEDVTNYQRVKLCDMKLRSFRLGCAHSNSNNTFTELLKPIAASDSLIEKKLQRFNDIILSIQNLDHHKGNLERDYADGERVTNIDQKRKEEIAEKIGGLELEHDNLMSQLDQIRISILNYFDKIISNSQTGKLHN